MLYQDNVISRQCPTSNHRFTLSSCRTVRHFTYSVFPPVHNNDNNNAYDHGSRKRDGVQCKTEVGIGPSHQERESKKYSSSDKWSQCQICG